MPSGRSPPTCRPDQKKINRTQGHGQAFLQHVGQADGLANQTRVLIETALATSTPVAIDIQCLTSNHTSQWVWAMYCG
jgi:hypothetical protein